SGVTPTVATTAPASTGGFGQFLGNNAGSLLQGLGQGYSSYLQAQELAEQREADRQFLRERDQRLQDSYNVPLDVLSRSTAPSTPSARAPSPQRSGRPRYQYDPTTRRITYA